LSIPFLSVAWLGVEAGGTCRQPSGSTKSDSCLEYGEAKT
jgi:hypothetical protein